MLKQNGIPGNFLNVMAGFLSIRKQIVAFNGQHSKCVNIEAEVPQGSVLEPLFFLIYIDDLSDGFTSDSKIFVDDTSLFSFVQNMNSVTFLSSKFK